MISYFGDFAEDDTVLIPFNTFDSNDPSASVTVTNLIASDIYVHKDGSTTDIVTDGATVAIDFDTITGNHLVTIDTSASADYSTGSEYAVRIEGVTVDGATINAWIGAFSIERAGGALAVAKLIQAAVITNAAGTDIAADIIAVKAETAAIVADTNELQTDDIPGAIAALNDIAVNDILDATLTSHVTADSLAVAVKDILADTNELQTDDIPGTIAALNDPTAATTAAAVWDAVQSSHVTAGSFGEMATEIASILADTNELQTDDVPGLIAALNDIAAADVWSASLTELSSDPGASPAASGALLLLYMALRNQRDTTATSDEIHNNAGTPLLTATLSDDATTFSKSKYV